MQTADVVQIKVNTFNRLKKIRAGIVYDSITAVIDELLQNCQRSFIVGNIENPTIDIVINEDTLIIRDNGNGCEDPQDIFEFETSGWDIVDAFGQGGSESMFQIADTVSIQSRNWKATIDVLEMLETSNLEVQITPLDDYFNGYEVILKGYKIFENSKLIETYITTATKYYECTVYINGELQDKKDLHEVNSIFTEKINNNFYVATLGVQRGYKDIQVFYEKRKVCDLWKPGVTGIIELKRNAVTLKAPDRKQIIYDSKRTKFEQVLNNDCKVLYLEFVKVATDEQFDEYESGIDQNLTPQDYADYLPSGYLTEYERKQQSILESEVPSDKTVQDIFNFEKVNKSDSHGIYVPSSVGLKQSYSMRPTGALRKRIGKILNRVWCELNDKDSLKEKINLVESFGISVLYSKGKLYSKVFEYWGIPYIDDVIERTESSYIISSPSGNDESYRRELTKKEDRLMTLLSKIEKHFGLSNVFVIADVTEHLSISNNGEDVIDTIIKKSVAPIKDKNKIYLDRSSLNLGKVNVSNSKASITKFDVLIILLNINIISSGLSQILYDTVEHTVEHYKKSEKIGKEIALLLGTL